jgi:rRNA maturation endonuclease Nob1
MPRYLCPKCNEIFYGWSIKYKYESRCPICGGELRQINDNKESRKVEGYHKEDPEISLSKLLKLDI